MLYTKWNSPEALRSRVIRSVTQETKTLNYSTPNDKADVDYAQGQLLENAGYLLKDAIDLSQSRDLHEVVKVSQSIKNGDHVAYHNTANLNDFGMQKIDGLPENWSLPEIGIYDQRDRLRKAAALIIMELERLDRMGINGRDVGYGMFNPEHMAEKKASDASLLKMRNAHSKKQQLDIYRQLADSAGAQINQHYAGSNVTTSTQPQFTGTVQPMP